MLEKGNFGQVSNDLTALRNKWNGLKKAGELEKEYHLFRASIVVADQNELDELKKSDPNWNSRGSKKIVNKNNEEIISPTTLNLPLEDQLNKLYVKTETIKYDENQYED